MRAILFFMTFAVFVVTVVWRVDQMMFGDKLAWAEAQSRAQMSALATALETEVNSLKNLLVLSFSEVEQGRKDYSSNRPYSQFQMMAKLLPPNLKDDKKDWQVVSSFFKENSTVKNWAPSYITLVLKAIKESDIRSGSANVYSMMDPSRKPYLLLVIRGSGNWYAGLLGTEVFQGMMDRQKGLKSTVFVVNLQGQALGHTTQEYVGSLLTEDPIVAELMKSNVGNGFGTFQNLKGDAVQGLYEQVERSNIYAVITTSISSLSAGRNSVRMQLAIMGLGLGLIGLAAFVFTDRNNKLREASNFPQAPPLMTPAVPALASVASGNLMTGPEKMKAYTQVASSLSHELKPPLTSILGHAQLAMNQSEGAPLEHLQRIEKEARSARDIVQKLLIFAGEDKLPSQKIGLETPMNKALKAVEGKILSKGIKLTKNIQSVPQFTMSADLVAKAIENVLVNSIEAMERAPRKELTISLQAEGPQISLSIADTGEGISAPDLNKIFDPFFTTRSGGQHVGLGLSTAMGIFKEAFGEVHVDSEKAKGTTVKIVFNPQEGLLTSSGEIPAAAPMKATPIRNKPAEDVPIAAAATSAKLLPSAPLPSEAQKASVLERAERAAFAPPAAKEPTYSDPMPMDPLLVDTTIERLIEDDLMDMPPIPSKDDFTLRNRQTAAEEQTKIEISSASAELPQAEMPAMQASAEPQASSMDLDLDFELQVDAALRPNDTAAAPRPKPSAAPAPAPAPNVAAKPEKSFSSKIDRPKIEIRKKSSRLDEVQVAVRRPGERL
jgi:two-component system NtrC family sensor kinase